MHVVIVEFQLRPGAEEAFLPLMEAQAGASLEREAQCRVFDVCQDPENPRRIVLYEVYETPEAFAAHLETEHFLTFDAAVAELVAEKRVETLTRRERTSA